MSNALQTTALLAAIKTAVVTAWGNIPVTYGPPKLAAGVGLSEQAPFCEVLWEAVDVSFAGLGGSVQSPSQANTFTIHGTFPFPEDPTQPIDIEKVTQANLLIAQLQNGPGFAGIGLKPLVTKIDPADHHATTDGVYDLTLTFITYTLASHH